MLDAGDREKLQMLEAYVNAAERGAGCADVSARTSEGGSPTKPLPKSADEVDEFMRELAPAAGADKPPPEE